MIEIRSKAVDNPLKVGRIIGTFGGQKPGLNVVFVGGIHGNEPSGVFALNQVFESLRQSEMKFRGKMIGIAGNLPALSEGTRFIDEDLNRIWAPNGVGKKSPRESLERSEIIDLLEEVLKENDQPVLVFDLHTTSAKSIPFIAIGDTLRNRKIASQFPVPIILGLEEHMKGTLFSFLSRSGISSIIFEAGQHDDPISIKNHISFIWQSLVVAGCIKEKHLPSKIRMNSFSFKSNIYETFFRLGLSKHDNFIMKPGFKNFDPIKKNQSIASLNGKEVVSFSSGKIFLPLYQKQGKDGYFMVRRVRKFWVLLSASIRTLGLDRKLYLLPGVTVHPKFKSGYIIQLSKARWLAKQIFHLLGFRVEKIEGNKLEVKRREFDFEPPPNSRILERIEKIRSQLP